ncbi:FecCD family ABC transporter permease [Porticoccus sp.]|nr:MAG: iron ABC transporter permease [Gammaproteobacteria bacterium]
MHRLPPRTFLIGAWLLLVAAVVLGLLSGPVSIAPGKLLELFSRQSDMDVRILQDLRLPRVLLAMLAGACLASCGAVMQGLFRNPLADPSLIGVSSGASLGASAVIFFGGVGFLSGVFELTAIAAGAFIGGLVATALVYRLASTITGTSVSTMLLAGIAITALSGAATSLFGFFADNEMLRRISLWQMGNLDSANWSRVGIIAVAVLPLMVLLPREGRALNAILLGESEARHLGIAVESLKGRLILLTALGVGVAVAVSGVVAFVGLIVPHLVRLMIGPDHRYLIPGSAILGAVLLLLADTGARSLMAPAELPTGVVTALLGAPFFVALLLQQRRKVLE